MRLSKERIGIIARDVVKGLAARHCLSADFPEAELVNRISQILVENFTAEDRLDAEARQILKAYESEIQKGDADLHKMFLMIKKKLAKERGMIL